ncbi:MAG: Crp/Fnr family transcriptional regulator [Chloroflexota bacterium]
MDSIIEALRRTQIFEGLSDKQLHVIEPLCKRVHCLSGKVFFAEGDEASNLFVVEEGEVSLEVDLFLGDHLRPKTIAVERVGKNDTFGWSALVEPRRMTTTARCSRDVDIIAINGDDLKALLKKSPDIGVIVMENVAKIVRDRLVHTRQRLIAEQGLEALYAAHPTY